MKTQKVLAGVAALAMVGACGVALAGCNASESSSVKSYTLKIEDWAEWTDSNEHPMSLGQGEALWGLDTWLASGTKVNTDDEGNPVGVYYQFTLDIDDNSAIPDYVEYTLTYNVHADPSDLYKEPVDASYSFTGYAWEIEGGYHLMVPQYAEVTIVGEAFAETMSQGITATGTYTGAHGGTLYYFYCNSDLYSAGVKFDFPFTTNPIQGLYACDVLVSDSAITEFKVTGDRAPVLSVPEVDVSCDCDNNGGSADDNTGDDDTPGDTTGDETAVVPDNETDYSFAPGWATMEGFKEVGDLNGTYTMTAATINSWKQESSGNGWENVAVTFELVNDGSVTVTIQGGGNPTVLTGSYGSQFMMGKDLIVINLDDIAGSLQPDGTTSAGTDFANAENVGGLTIGFNTYYWISQSGVIALTLETDGTCSPCLNMGGGAGPAI